MDRCYRCRVALLGSPPFCKSSCHVLFTYTREDSTEWRDVGSWRRGRRVLHEPLQAFAGLSDCICRPLLFECFTRSRISNSLELLSLLLALICGAGFFFSSTSAFLRSDSSLASSLRWAFNSILRRYSSDVIIMLLL